MITTKVFVEKNDQAGLICPYCGTRRTLQVKRFKNRRDPLKVRCICRGLYQVLLESRRAERKETYSQGYFKTLCRDGEWGKILIRNVSRLGIGFVTLSTHNVKSGDQIKITLTSDKVNQRDIDADATVKFVKNNYMGCEFAEPLPLVATYPSI